MRFRTGSFLHVFESARNREGGEAWEPEQWSASDCLIALRRRKKSLLVVTGAGLLAALILSMVQPRWYQSSASLEVLGLNDNFLNARDINPTAGPGADGSAVYVQTQADLLESDALLELVAKELHLDQRPEFRGAPGFWQRWIQTDENPQQNLRSTVEELKKHIRVSTSRNSRILEIIDEAREAKVAADIANRVAENFIEQRTQERQKAAEQVHESLRVQLERIRLNLVRTQAKLQGYGVPLATLGKSRSARAPASDLTLDVLEREFDANRHFYEVMQQRVNDAAVAAAVRQPTVRVISRAEPAAYPYRPNLLVNAAIGLFGSLLIAIGWVMLQEQTSTVVRSPGEAAMYLTVPELGAIPRVRASQFGPGRIAAHFQQNPMSADPGFLDFNLTESFRSTLTSILSEHKNGDAPRSFVVTSASPMEGKTTVVSNLGIVLAEIGKKVLLIDGDLRRPRLHKVFGHANSWGLTDILRERNAIEGLPLEALVKKTSIPNLYLLPSGPCTDNIFGLLYAGRLSSLLPRFREEFEFVLIDAPPCLQFADARIMARYTEQLVLVVRANTTARRTAQHALERLRLDGIPVMGVILNNWVPEYPRYRYPAHEGQGTLA